MPKFVAAIEQGTPSTRCRVCDPFGATVAADQKEHRQIYPQAGWVEHDPEEIWACTQGVVEGALRAAGIAAADNMERMCAERKKAVNRALDWVS
jgi:glycerol kinase